MVFATAGQALGGVTDGITPRYRRQDVFHAGAGRKELSGEAIFTDGMVGGRKRVTMEAKGAIPGFGEEIDMRVGVEDAMASSAEEGGVRERREVGDGGERAANDGEGDGKMVRRFAGSRPGVPCPAKTFGELEL